MLAVTHLKSLRGPGSRCQPMISDFSVLRRPLSEAIGNVEASDGDD